MKQRAEIYYMCSKNWKDIWEQFNLKKHFSVQGENNLDPEDSVCSLSKLPVYFQSKLK